jgi:hypothetical protein
MTPRRLFALDQNFPEPVCKMLGELLPAELVPVRQIDASLSEVDDWQLLLALQQHPRPWDGLITNDDSMLRLDGNYSATRLSMGVRRGRRWLRSSS